MKDFGTCGGLFWGTNPSGKLAVPVKSNWDDGFRDCCASIYSRGRASGTQCHGSQWQKMSEAQTAEVARPFVQVSCYLPAFYFFPVDALFWGWGQYDTWTRRRTVLDLIRLTYYEAFKTELLRDAAGDEAADWGMLDFRVDMVSSVAPTEWKVDGFLICLRLIVHRGCGKHGLSFPMSSKRVGLKRWISQFVRLHFSVTCVCIDVRCAIAIDFKMV